MMYVLWESVSFVRYRVFWILSFIIISWKCGLVVYLIGVFVFFLYVKGRESSIMVF